MRKCYTTLLLLLTLCSCAHIPTRAERIEETATDYLRRTTRPMVSYTVIGRDTESDSDTFVGCVGYRCKIAEQYNVYKVVFVAMRGDSVAYVGTNEEIANQTLNR